MWICGYSMTELVEDDSALQEFLFDLHISVGVTLLVLLIVRITFRIVIAPPPMPSLIQGWERIGAHLGHAALYILPALVITAGWVETNFGGHTVKWFGMGMPAIFPEVDEFWQDLSQEVHMILAYTMLVMAVVHVAAAYKHRWIDGHDVLYRMT